MLIKIAVMKGNTKRKDQLTKIIGIFINNIDVLKNSFINSVNVRNNDENGIKIIIFESEDKNYQ